MISFCYFCKKNFLVQGMAHGNLIYFRVISHDFVLASLRNLFGLFPWFWTVMPLISFLDFLQFHELKIETKQHEKFVFVVILTLSHGQAISASANHLFEQTKQRNQSQLKRLCKIICKPTRSTCLRTSYELPVTSYELKA